MRKINSVLKEALNKVEPKEKELWEIKKAYEIFVKSFEKRLKKLGINAEIFLGGSFAKNTMIKKDKFDIDIFVRFNQEYNDKDISKITEKALKGVKNLEKIHGSRDYFRIKINKSFYIEVIPVIKIKSPKEARNITDLSSFHVRYINRKIKDKKILKEILLAKAFCYANNCYGAESYIHGFSGYSLELLIYYYKSFLKFIRAICKKSKTLDFSGKEKIVIDIEKSFKNKKRVLMDINSSKLESPIILIDPTYKQRNVLAALSEETFKRFKEKCRRFLKNPSIKYFEKQKTDLEKIKKDAIKKKYEFLLLEIKTKKQEGDIAGSKLIKFYNHLSKEIEKFFDIKKRGFNYNNKKNARCFFVVKRKKEKLYSGPPIEDKKNFERFKKEHNKIFIKNKKSYSKEKLNFNLRNFLERWKKDNRKKIKDMSISALRII